MSETIKDLEQQKKRALRSFKEIPKRPASLCGIRFADSSGGF